MDEADALGSEALSQLEGLEAVHADTYRLACELLPPPAQTTTETATTTTTAPGYLLRWSSADRSLVASTFEQIRSRHAPAVETLADVVLALRRVRSLRNGDGRGQLQASAYFCGINLTLIDEFLRCRLGVQLLCDHYVKIDKGKSAGGGHKFGLRRFGRRRERCPYGG